MVQTDLEIEKNTGFPPEPGKVSSSTNQDVGQINKNKVGPITILRRPEASSAPTISGSFKHFQSHVAAGFASLSFKDDDKKEDLSDEDSDDDEEEEEEEEEEDSDGWDFKCVGLDHDPACPDEGISRKY